MDITRGPVALLGDQQIHRHRFLLFAAAAAFVVLAARLIQQTDNIGILFNGAGFSQVGQPGFSVLVLLQFAVQLAQDDDRHIQFLGQRLDAVGDVCDLLLPVFSPARSRMEELEVVNHKQFDAILLRHAPGLRAQLQNG